MTPGGVCYDRHTKERTFQIASLALAGIMAVSMLAGCKDGSNGGNSGSSSDNTNQNAGYSAYILDKTDVAKLYVTAEDDARLTSAVKAVAKNAYTGGGTGALASLTKTYWGNAIGVADSIMGGGATYSDDGLANEKDLKVTADLNKDASYTYYIMWYVSRKQSDDVIDELVATQLDTIAAKLGAPNPGEGDTYKYTVSLAKTDWLKGNDASMNDDAVLIGVAITLDYTNAKY